VTDLRFGDRVIKGQKLGLEVDRRAEVLAPANGVVRHIGVGKNGRANIIHILSREDENVRVGSGK
jgi:Na+-translocating ferredoxin:NAD+ oxidoreductase RnfC subunit